MIKPNNIQTHHTSVTWLLIFCVMSCFFISLQFGAVSLGFEDLLLWLFGQANHSVNLILGHIRLPRALLALTIGAILATCGVVTQSLFRNPLAEPAVIGVSAGASAGASIAIVFIQASSGWVGFSVTSLSAFFGAALTVALVYRIATGPYGTSVVTMLLAGIGMSFVAGSLSSFLEFIANEQMLRRISLWRMGGLDGANLTAVLLSALVLILTYCIIWSKKNALNALLLGESEARHLGFNVNRVKAILILCVAAGVGTCVALCGTIAFVGLIVPQGIRMMIGPNHHHLLPFSALCGSLLLILSDVFARILLAPGELPVGLITAFLGAPLFLLLLRQQTQLGLK